MDKNQRRFRSTGNLLCASLHVVVALNAPLTTVAAHSSLWVGLENLGNTCYLNAQLQCAYHIPLVRRLVSTQSTAATASLLPDFDKKDDDVDTKDDDGTHKPAGSITSVTKDNSFTVNEEESDSSCHTKESEALISLRRVFEDMNLSQQSHCNPVAPRILCQNLGISVWEQQDSQEFWKLLLPALDLPELSDLYTGTYENYIVAVDGSGRERRRDETFLDVSLSVTEDDSTGSNAKDQNSLVASLREQFGEPELLSVAAGNAWRPEAGADMVDAHKGYRLTVQGLPAILQCHLKRFHFDWNTEATSKRNNVFSFPLMLDLKKIVDYPNEHPVTLDNAATVLQDQCMYELQAVVVHMGEYNSGHYYAYVRPDVRIDDWYRFNDAKVTKVSFADVEHDAFGGKQVTTCFKETEASTRSDKHNPKRGNILVQFVRSLFGQGRQPGEGSDFGFGGPTSNAYVLQYIRRCDIPRLYDDLL